jgi:hypothetical protein
MSEYEQFKKFIYDDMIREWKNTKLSYLIRQQNLDLIKQRDSAITNEKIIEDFRKYPLVKEVFMSIGQIVILPK